MLRSNVAFAFKNVVLMIDPGNQRGHWPLGLIKEAFSNPDGKVRVVRVRTGSKDYVRPITRLCLLELQRVRRQQNTVLFGEEDVSANARSLTLMPSAGTGKQKTA